MPLSLPSEADVQAAPPPDCPARIAYDLTLALPSSWAAGDRLSLRLVPGWDRSNGLECVAVTGGTTRGAESSPASPVLLSAPQCLPAPEAPTSALLLAGLVVLVLARARGPFELVKNPVREGARLGSR